MQTGSPLGFYFLIRHKTKLITRNIAANLVINLLKVSIPFINHKSPLFYKGYYHKFIPLGNNIKNNFVNIISKYSDIELFNKYKYTLDLYNFGLTILYIIKNLLKLKMF